MQKRDLKRLKELEEAFDKAMLLLADARSPIAKWARKHSDDYPMFTENTVELEKGLVKLLKEYAQAAWEHRE